MIQKNARVGGCVRLGVPARGCGGPAQQWGGGHGAAAAQPGSGGGGRDEHLNPQTGPGHGGSWFGSSLHPASALRFSGSPGCEGFPWLREQTAPKSLGT